MILLPEVSIASLITPINDLFKPIQTNKQSREFYRTNKAMELYQTCPNMLEKRFWFTRVKKYRKFYKFMKALNYVREIAA